MKNIIKKIAAVAMACTMLASYSGVINTPFSNQNSVVTVSAAFKPYNGKTKNGCTNFYGVSGDYNTFLYNKPIGTVVAIIDVKGDWGKVSDAKGGQWVELKDIQRISEVEAIQLTRCAHDCNKYKKEVKTEYRWEVESHWAGEDDVLYFVTIYSCQACHKLIEEKKEICRIQWDDFLLPF